MPKCSTCRKHDSLDTLWDKVRLFFFRFFHTDIIDLGQQKYTQGFADGYRVGFRHAEEEEKRALKLNNQPHVTSS